MKLFRLLRQLRSNPRLHYLFAHLPHLLLGVTLVLVFSRLVVADEFGKYAKGFAYINIVGSFCYGWLQISLLRLAKGNENSSGPNLKAILLSIIVPIGPCFLLAEILNWLGFIAYPTATASATVAYSSSVCLSQYARGINSAKLYGLLGITRLLVVLGVALTFANQIPNAATLLYALAAGGAAATFLGIIVMGLINKRNSLLKEIRPNNKTKLVGLSDLFHYGAPASLSIVAVMLLIHGDRFIIGLFMGDAETAYYSAQADLARQMIYPIITALSVSLVPIALRKKHEHGFEAARNFVDKESTTTLNLILPILVMLIIFGNDIMSIMLPTDYVKTAEPIAALVAIGAFLTGCRLVRFDPLFHLLLGASKIGIAALVGLLFWGGFIIPITYYYGLIGATSVGILSATGSLFYSYYAVITQKMNISIFAKTTFVQVFILLCIAIATQQFILDSTEITISDLLIVLGILYVFCLFIFPRLQ